MLKLQNILFAIALLFCATNIGAQNRSKISVEETVFNYGTIAEADGPATHIFTIKNIGTAPLVIQRITASCGCTQPEWDKAPIAPGATGEIKVTYNPQGRPGPFYKTVSIFNNTGNGPFNVAIKGEVSSKVSEVVINYAYSIGNLKLDSKNVLFSTIHQDEILTERVNISNNSDGPISISMGKTPDYLNVTVTPQTVASHETGVIAIQLNAKEAKRKGRIANDLDVTVKKTGARNAEGKIEVRANIIDNFSKLSASQKAQAPVALFSETLLEFGKMNNKGGILPLRKGKITRSFDITNTGKSKLTIYSVTTDDSNVSISGGKKVLNPKQTTTFKISVRPKDIKSRLEALVNVVCNDPNGPIRLIKVTGYK